MNQGENFSYFINNRMKHVSKLVKGVARSSESEISLICFRLVFYGFYEAHDVPQFDPRVGRHIRVLQYLVQERYGV
jgi:hypothetical protein